MKFFIFALALLVGLASGLSAQTVTVVKAGDRFAQAVDVLQVTAWSPFTADSAATVTSNTFSIAQYDSIECWVRSTSVVGVPKWSATLLGSFDGTNFATTSLGTVADTTSVKTEVLTFVGRIPTKGAQIGRLTLVGSSVAAPPNEEDSIVNIYLVGRKRGSRN